ncbi:hypothetical protein KC19_6G034200 [Ceratodon purpureus]|uniref:Uncharacterized protein n=1 Tax=Ceratodon purpureus TaxID=3225 RepID=A0A8T0HDW7_CERPU|nr:hypothetical protein KC19_6G034200 [Ceratodon purpureus]
MCSTPAQFVRLRSCSTRMKLVPGDWQWEGHGWPGGHTKCASHETAQGMKVEVRWSESAASLFDIIIDSSVSDSQVLVQCLCRQALQSRLYIWELCKCYE